jgi:hypothetical protein
MIPAVHQSDKPAPGFTSDPRQMEERGQRSEGLGKAFKVESLNVSAHGE